MNTTYKISVMGYIDSEPQFECRGLDKITTFKLVDQKKDLRCEYHIVSRGNQATTCKQRLHKGNLCCIEGHYNETRDSIIADKVTLLKL